MADHPVMPLSACQWCRAGIGSRPALAALLAVFPSETGKLRARGKTQAGVRDLFAFGALTGIGSHTFRQTTASLLDESGLTARMIADRLGHAQPTMTDERLSRAASRRHRRRRARIPGSEQRASASSLINLTYTLPMPTTPGRA